MSIKSILSVYEERMSISDFKRVLLDNNLDEMKLLSSGDIVIKTDDIDYDYGNVIYIGTYPKYVGYEIVSGDSKRALESLYDLFNISSDPIIVYSKNNQLNHVMVKYNSITYLYSMKDDTIYKLKIQSK